jgi:UDP-N-acetylglucosamine 1-carboxyvinyltransferase
MDDEARLTDDEFLARLGRAIREAREEQGLSERELADAVRGISLAGIRALEAGRRNLDYERWVRLARALDTTPGLLCVRAEGRNAE